MASKRKMYQDFDLDEDEIEKSNAAELILHAGQLYNISGLVFQGNEKTFIVMNPNSCEVEFSGTEYEKLFMLFPSIAELQQIIKRTDDPLIFQEDETGLLKAIVRKQQNVISGAVQQQIWYRDGFRCLLCGKYIPDIQLTIDHWIPVEKDGENIPSNYISTCRSCNKQKGNQLPEDYCKKYNLDYTGIQLYLDGKASKSFIRHL